jgi:Na+/phosphate symporter
MFLICRSDGYIDGYDLCYKLNDTNFSYKVTDLSLTTMSLNVKGDKLLVGDEDGKVYLIKLSKSFYDCSNKTEVDNKKNMLNKLFEREQTKEKMLTTTKKMIQKNEGTNLEKLEKIKQEKIKEIDDLYKKYTKEFRDEIANDNQGEEQQQPPQQEQGENEGEAQPQNQEGAAAQ